MLGRTDDFLSEKVKEHGIARFGKRKEPVIGVITGFSWRRVRDSNPRDLSVYSISSVVRLWQIHVWSRPLWAALLRGRNADAARGCGHSDPYRPEAIRTAPKFK